jgi:hypothetical protein
MKSVAVRLAGCDWVRISTQLDEDGYALTGTLLSPAECNALVRLYSRAELFRSRVVMARHNFGRGEYRYFAAPVPALVRDLREHFYPALSSVANRWSERLGFPDRYPPTLAEFLEVCRRHRQTRPTPLMLRYEAGDYNCLHQDLYGEIAFPLQATSVLSRRSIDYTGGEFLLTEQRPRMQTRGHAVTIERGQFIIFANRHRPVRGARGYYRVNMRHGVSRLASGTRYALGLIFHDAK